MRVRTDRVATALLAVLTSITGCSAKEPGMRVDSGAYVQPNGWQTECLGRWWVDVPSPIDMGASYFTTGDYAEFFDYTPEPLKDSTRAMGGVSIGPVAFTESVPLRERVPLLNSAKTLSGLRFMAMRVAGHHFIRDYPDESYRQLLPRTDTRSAWAAPGRFQVSLQLAEDERGRFYWKDSFQYRDKLGAEDRGNPDSPPIEEPLAREVLDNLVPRYSVRKPGHWPQAAGICTPHGFFADPPTGTERDARVAVSLVDRRYENLVLHVDIKTRMPHNESALIPTEDIRQAITPWDAAQELAKEHKKKCRTQQGTASRDLFGCAFAGATGIRGHWDVQFLKLANGQEARVLVITYPPSISDYKAYEITIETAGKKGSVTEPRIVIRAEGIDGITDEKAFRGKKPPPIEEAFKLAVTLAKSLRPRPGAISPGRPVVDPWAKFR